jgi:N6-adenosine-specific RNA methylase IME4
MAITEFENTDKKYKLIYADPPWLFKSYSEKGEGRSPQKLHYGCMNLKDICDLPVGNMADDDCVLLMWVTDPFLEKGFEVIKSWGFTYKTVGFYWAKQNMRSDDLFMGLGYWTRANPEQCLLATKGKPKRVSKSVKKLVVDHRREHSRKPDSIYESIEQLVDGPYLELFSRTTKPGWDVIGNDVDKFEISS